MLRRSALNRRLGHLALATTILATTASTPALAHQTVAVPGESAMTGIARLLALVPGPVFRQQNAAPAPRGRIISSQIELSRERARLRLELADGRVLEFKLQDNQARVDERLLGPAPRGEPLDRAWRDLLTVGMEAPANDFATILSGWQPPPGETGAALRRELIQALESDAPAQAAGADDTTSDTVAALRRRIAELEERLDAGAASQTDESVKATSRRRPRVVATIDLGKGRDAWYSPLRHIGRGLVGILSDLMVLAVLAGIGFAIVFFARKQLEAVADTIRQETLRSGLVGLAATFLVLPGYILGIIALVISIVGIPLLLAWVPFFWVVVGIAATFGYLAVGHAIGEALTERRFYGGEWAGRTNSYYYVLIGLTVLFALYLASHLVQMAGPWFGFVRGFLFVLAIIGTWLAATVGFGAVLLTRAGTRPRSKSTAPSSADLDLDGLFEEEAHV